MTRKQLLNILLLLLVSCPVIAQKVKYKELYGLLSMKQYDQAEPFLKIYLKENTDNPNAYLFMGMIYQEKAFADDVLIDTDKCIQHMDSSILFYDKSLKGLTEKEIKRNSEYYSAYNRRDLRTGEFGVKLSDVQFDLEKRITALRERIDKVKMTKFYFTHADELYKRSTDLFVEIQKSFPGLRELYLRADENTIASLKALSVRFDSCIKMFDNYKVSLSNLGKTKYNQTLILKDISDFSKDGNSLTDFYKDEVRVWEYKNFASTAVTVIENEVNPTRQDLVKYDIEINKLRQRLEADSVSVRSDLTKLIEKLLNNQLKKYDQDPLPMDIFALKVSDLEYQSTRIENKSIHRGEDIQAKLKAVQAEMTFLKKMDSVTTRLVARDLDGDIKNYQQFVNETFTKGDILKSYIRSQKENVTRELGRRSAEVHFYEKSMKWLVDSNDSIPLFMDPVVQKFKPLVLESEYTAGVSLGDSALGYFYSITPSRKPDVRVKFHLTGLGSTPDKLSNVKAIVTSDQGKHIYFVVVYSESAAADGKYTATVAKIYKSDGLSWSNAVSCNFIPREAVFVQETGELLLKADSETYVSIDKGGKVLNR